MEQFKFMPQKNQERVITQETHDNFKQLREKLITLPVGSINPEIKKEILDMKESLNGSYKTSLEGDQAVAYMNGLQDELERLEMSPEDWDKKQTKDRIKQVGSGVLDLAKSAVVGTLGNAVSGFRATNAAIEFYEEGRQKIKGEKPSPKFPEQNF